MRDTPKRDAEVAGSARPPKWGVLVEDDDRAGAESLAALARLGRPDLAVVLRRPGEDWPQFPALHLALVSIAADGTGLERALGLIREARRHGLVVFAQARNLAGWTVAQKCRPLIAGAVRVLDASSRNFAGALYLGLDAALKALGARRDEEHFLRERLRALGVEGGSPAMLEIFRRVLRFAALSDLPVLLTGETGTGKERFTQALHQADPKRSCGPLVAVNCAALASTLAESELFGHRRGAFTGADRDRKGLVRAAHGGVLYLDEIGDLDLALQAKLLRVLQEGRVLGVGEDHEVVVDVRVIAATNRNLQGMMAAGRFRADLYHRLSVLTLEIPPLRGRTMDIAVLARHFLDKYRALHPSARHEPSADFMEALGRLPLPGNVRQLENVIRQALINKADEAPLALSDLPAEALEELAASEVRSPAPPGTDAAAPPDAVPAMAASLLRIVEENDWNLGRSVRACEREMLVAALRRADGNQTRAASLLGVTSRSIYNKVRKLGLQL